MSLYSEYLKEREDFEVFEHEGGFATYAFNEHVCYIRDIYVREQYRKAGIASHMADKITEIAKERGCSVLMGSVSPNAKGATTSLKVLLSYGFELLSVEGQMIYFRKEI